MKVHGACQEDEACETWKISRRDQTTKTGVGTPCLRHKRGVRRKRPWKQEAGVETRDGTPRKRGLVSLGPSGGTDSSPRTQRDNQALRTCPSSSQRTRKTAPVDRYPTPPGRPRPSTMDKWRTGRGGVGRPVNPKPTLGWDSRRDPAGRREACLEGRGSSGHTGPRGCVFCFPLSQKSHLPTHLVGGTGHQ